MIGIMFIVVAIIILLIRHLISPSNNNTPKMAGVGTIKQRIQKDGRIFFYVEFQDSNSLVHIGKSITYASTKGKYHEGDTANILYYFSPKGSPFVVIEDSDLVSCEQASASTDTYMLIAAIALIVIGAISLLFSFLG